MEERAGGIKRKNAGGRVDNADIAVKGCIVLEGNIAGGEEHIHNCRNGY